jgi:UDP-3-O-[3-hydroxymyristoyl] N-acetylglucosamine deacetylase
MQSATILLATAITGKGIFSGEPCRLLVEPAPLGTGIVFMRNGVEIPACAASVQEQPQTTVLARAGQAAMVSEHLLAACWACGIDHARLILDTPEVPNQDGSAYPFYSALVKAGRVELPAMRQPVPVLGTVRVEDEHGSYLEFTPGDELWVDYTFAHPELGEQHLSRRLERGDAVRDLLRARSFITEREALAAVNAGIVKHTDVDMALLIRDGKPHRRLRYKDEYARHKVLDMLGDLYLLPYELCGQLTGFRSGHRLNRMLARKILELAGAA